jgi:hypothetical protein
LRDITVNNSTLQKNWLAKALLVSPLFILFAVGLFCFAGKGESISFAAAGLEHPVVTTQLPLDTAAEQQGALADGTLRARFGEGGRLVLISPDASTRVLTEDFHSASDPTISFDGKQILFAAKKTATDSWDIFEMGVDGSNVRQVTDLISRHFIRLYLRSRGTS